MATDALNPDALFDRPGDPKKTYLTHRTKKALSLGADGKPQASDQRKSDMQKAVRMANGDQAAASFIALAAPALLLPRSGSATKAAPGGSVVTNATNRLDVFTCEDLLSPFAPSVVDHAHRLTIARFVAARVGAGDRLTLRQAAEILQPCVAAAHWLAGQPKGRFLSCLKTLAGVTLPGYYQKTLNKEANMSETSAALLGADPTFRFGEAVANLRAALGLPPPDLSHDTIAYAIATIDGMPVPADPTRRFVGDAAVDPILRAFDAVSVYLAKNPKSFQATPRAALAKALKAGVTNPLAKHTIDVLTRWHDPKVHTHQERYLYIYMALLDRMPGTPWPAVAPGGVVATIERELAPSYDVWTLDRIMRLLAGATPFPPLLPNITDIHTAAGRAAGSTTLDFALYGARVDAATEVAIDPD